MSPTAPVFSVSGAVARTPKYPEAIRSEAVKRYLDGQEIVAIAEDLGIPASNINYWVRKAGHEPNRRVSKQAPDLVGQLAERYISLERRFEALSTEIAQLWELAQEQHAETLAEVRKILRRRA